MKIHVNYKLTVNKVAKLEVYPLPRIDELFTSLSGGQALSKLDLLHAYLQIPLAENSQVFAAMNSHKGLFHCTRLPSAPAIFQRTMETLLQGLQGVCMFVTCHKKIGKNGNRNLQNS